MLGLKNQRNENHKTKDRLAEIFFTHFGSVGNTSRLTAVDDLRDLLARLTFWGETSFNKHIKMHTIFGSFRSQSLDRRWVMVGAVENTTALFKSLNLIVMPIMQILFNLISCEQLSL